MDLEEVGRGEKDLEILGEIGVGVVLAGIIEEGVGTAMPEVWSAGSHRMGPKEGSYLNKETQMVL